MRIKCVIISLLLFVPSLEVLAFLKCQPGDNGTLKLATDDFNRLATLYRKKAVDRLEYDRAAVFFYEAQLCTQTISRSEFCRIALPFIVDLNSDGNSAIVHGKPSERRERIGLLAEGKAFCKDL